ncbi:MAG TPA: DUF3833 family protein [Caulobacteraceae bacterium]|jgi:hypothetical protein
MTNTADMVLERAVEQVAHDAAELPVWPVGALAFAPESFFLGRTEGAGVVRDPFGRIVRRCQITTLGAFSDAQQALRFDEVFAYDDGEIDTWRWVMQPGRDGRYVAAEAKAGSGLTGERQGDDYVISFRRPFGRARGPLAPHYRSRFTLLAPDLAMKRADLSLLGAPLGSLSAFHRRMPLS